MQIKSSNDGLLTNYEVLDLIKERKAQRDYWRKDTIHLQPRIALENKIQAYMKNSITKSLSFEQIQGLLRQLKQLQLQLTEEEMIQLANLLPTSEVEMYLIVSNAAERLTEDQISVLLETIKSVLPPKDDCAAGTAEVNES
jgi:DNA-directed RNA polymerase subunit F